MIGGGGVPREWVNDEGGGGESYIFNDNCNITSCSTRSPAGAA